MAAEKQKMTSEARALRDKLAAELTKDDPDFNRFADLSEKLLATDPHAVRFTVDAGHIKRLGQELVGKAETALAELIKNAFDADATNCHAVFKDADSAGGTLVITDDGVGMNEEIIRQSWMRLSTGMKVSDPLSAKYRRSRAGRKGIGRFAVQRLGTKLTLETRTRGEKIGYRVTFDWEADYPQGASLSRVSNRLERFAKEANDHGTTLVIDDLRDSWTDSAIERVWRSVLLLQPPFPLRSSRAKAQEASDPGFNVTINNTADSQRKREWSVERSFLDHAVAVITGKVDAKGRATFGLRSKRLNVQDTHQPDDKFLAVGELEFRAHYFIFDARVVPGLTLREITEFARTYGGVRVYRNGFRVQPYGERDDDWLKLAYDTGRRTLLIPANNFNFFGQVLLDVEDNPLLEETSGREGLIENAAFVELQTLVRMGLEWGAKRIAAVRKRKVDPGKRLRPTPVEGEGPPSTALATAISTASSLAADGDDSRANQLVAELERVQQAQREYEEEAVAERVRSARYEEMLRILASLGMSIAIFGHEIGGALTIVSAEIKRLKLQAAARVRELDFGQAEIAVSRLGDLGRYIVSVMASAESRKLNTVALHGAVNRFVKQFSAYLDSQGISFETHVEPPHLRTLPIHRSEIDAVLFNFMTNSLKAIRRAEQPKGKIKISAARQDNFAVLSLQDNGVGIPDDLKERIFEAFFTTTDYSPDEVAGPGSGLGLKIVSDIASVYGGWVKVGRPERGYSTRLDFALPIAENQI